MDLFAAEIGMDPAEVRRENLIPADAFPFTGQTDTTYDIGDYEGALDRALEAAGYAELRAEQARRRAAGDAVQLGIGVSLYVEVTAGRPPGKEFAKVEIEADGSATVYTGTLAPRAGPATVVVAMLASDSPASRWRRSRSSHGDTDLVAEGDGHHGLALAAARRHGRAAGVGRRSSRRPSRSPPTLLEANPDDVVLDTASGRFTSPGHRPSAGPGPSWPAPPPTRATRSR